MMTYTIGQQVLVNIDLNSLSWYTTNLAPHMQWILATITQVSDSNQTVKCILPHHSYNKHPIITRTWCNYHVLDIADVMLLPGDKAAGI
eukprot:9628971-Ditylum_brightwellii.AAC.1